MSNMELRVRTVPQVSFYLPTSDTTGVSATYSFNGTTPVALTVSGPTNGAVTASLPYQENEGTADVVWTFTVPGSGSHTQSDKYEVVTPLLSRREVKEITPTLTDAQADMLETNVRHVIQSITGQTFGVFLGTIEVAGRGNGYLELPHRLLSLISVNGLEDMAGSLVIDADGYILRYYPWGVPPIKADAYGVNEATVGTIYDPRVYAIGRYRDGLVFNIDGKWGWETVPESVKEAARMLVNDYSCADIEYRDRYLTSMTAADWRIQFNQGAFEGSGNARVDTLLQPYIFKYRWLVV